MPLIQSARHTAEDLRAWSRIEDTARLHAQLNSFRKHLDRAVDALLSFTGIGPCYAGTSWGKDSTALAHLVASFVPRIPLVWVYRPPYDNPDCLLVRDAFLKRFPLCSYHEEVVECEPDPERPTYWRAKGIRRVNDATRPKQLGFARVNARFGSRYISGLRGEESAPRKARMCIHGENTKNTSAPLMRWSGWDVLAYLVTRDLPIHPAYACTLGGGLDVQRIRVGSLGGHHGEEWGRREWEQTYYQEERLRLDAIQRGGQLTGPRYYLQK